ncbi:MULTISPECIES: ABC transporter permease [unclassified Thioclava]|uniref:ABC transporter permease n=1 Tax=unclassified Thioclava TaxID=2621713 RepID=UPI000B53E784|nr:MULTISPECIES: ABC transporter permease [unclassified Thioclava]OWY05125.1 ribose ABC transporter [Thioclava sp. F1Mire-8]OWY06740.1 ribose ABC transporter [Thioclava sp. IC9]OWY08996.1 ribose ABC transporter [Thioclava sp. F42-5]OWY18348.1 ribose ABC transporter [Thioclava sp. JM3]PWE48543.1 ABC transporter permease [Thioclava sp. NG1]
MADTVIKSPVRWLAANPIWGFIVLIFVFFSFANPYFFAVQNFQNILVQTSTIGLIALGMTLVMINGNIDLSVGAVVALAASLCVDIQGWDMFSAWGNWALLPAVIAALVAGTALGALNGFIVWKTGVDAFIVTLGAMLGVRGLVFVYTKEQSFFAMNFSFSDFGSSNLGPLPTLAVLFLVCTVVVHLLLARTVHGRNTYAVGGNRAAAVNAGIRVGPHMLINFMIVGFFAALAGVTLSSQMGAATPNLGTNYELWVITSVVLGGTKLNGGAGNIIGTLGGVLAIGILRNGMNLMQVPAFYVLVILGTILIAVLLLDKQLNRKGKEELRV